MLRSPGPGVEETVATLPVRACLGVLAFELFAGPVWRFDLGNELWVDMTEPLVPADDLALFAGANAFAVRSAPGVWEVLQAGGAELMAPGRWRLTRLLRGQRGTEHAIGNPAPAGAPVVRLDGSVRALGISEAELGLGLEWLVGPMGAPLAGPAWRSLSFTPSGATGAWAGWDGEIAYRVDGAWIKLIPRPGWLVWVADEEALLVRTSAGWAEVALV